MTNSRISLLFQQTIHLDLSEHEKFSTLMKNVKLIKKLVMKIKYPLSGCATFEFLGPGCTSRLHVKPFRPAKTRPKFSEQTNEDEARAKDSYLVFVLEVGALSSRKYKVKKSVCSIFQHVTGYFGNFAGNKLFSSRCACECKLKQTI